MLVEIISRRFKVLLAVGARMYAPTSSARQQRRRAGVSVENRDGKIIAAACAAYLLPMIRTAPR